jgi:ATP-dependent Zn protease
MTKSQMQNALKIFKGNAVALEALAEFLLKREK